MGGSFRCHRHQSTSQALDGEQEPEFAAGAQESPVLSAIFRRSFTCERCSNPRRRRQLIILMQFPHHSDAVGHCIASLTCWLLLPCLSDGSHGPPAAAAAPPWNLKTNLTHSTHPPKYVDRLADFPKVSFLQVTTPHKLLQAQTSMCAPSAAPLTALQYTLDTHRSQSPAQPHAPDDISVRSCKTKT